MKLNLGKVNQSFINKLAISQKEINETIYWLELLKVTDYLKHEQFESFNYDAIELIKLITSSIKTAKQSLNPNFAVEIIYRFSHFKFIFFKLNVMDTEPAKCPPSIKNRA